MVITADLSEKEACYRLMQQLEAGSGRNIDQQCRFWGLRQFSRDRCREGNADD